MQIIHPVNYQFIRGIVDVFVALQDIFIVSSGSSSTLLLCGYHSSIISISQAGRWLHETKTAFQARLGPSRALLLRRRAYRLIR